MKSNFQTKAAVVAYLQSQDELIELKDGSFTYKGVYELSYGETEAPDFKPTRYKDGWGIKKIHHYQSSTHNVPIDGRCAKLCDETLEFTLLDAL